MSDYPDKKQKFSVVKEGSWQKGDYVPAAVLNLSADDLSRRLGVEFLDSEVDGLGRIRIQLFQLENGRQFILEQYLEAPPPNDRRTLLSCLNDARTMPADVTDIMAGIDIDSSSLTWVHHYLEHLPLDRGSNSQPKLGL